MKSKITYRDYYVAFLDVLGFSNIVKNQDAEYIHKIFSNVRKAKRYVKKDRGGRKTEETKFYFFQIPLCVRFLLVRKMHLNLLQATVC